MMMAARVVMTNLHELHLHCPGEPLQQSCVISLNNSDMMRHSRMAEILEPFTRIFFHPGQPVGRHQMSLRLDGLSFPRGHQIFAVQPPETKGGDGHSRAKRRFHHGRLFDVEMTRNARSAR